jgi:hypothetical protein
MMSIALEIHARLISRVLLMLQPFSYLLLFSYLLGGGS